MTFPINCSTASREIPALDEWLFNFFSNLQKFLVSKKILENPADKDISQAIQKLDEIANKTVVVDKPYDQFASI